MRTVYSGATGKRRKMQWKKNQKPSDVRGCRKNQEKEGESQSGVACDGPLPWAPKMFLDFPDFFEVLGMSG